jgi:tetratricopeptide (TPR) repeat protein
MKDNTEDIENYLNELLNAEEISAFEARLLVDSELSEELGLHRQLRGFIKENEVQNLKAEVKNWLKEEPEEEILLNSQKRKAPFSIGLLSKIAAGMAIFAGIAWYYFSNKIPENIEGEYLASLSAEAPAQLQGDGDRAVWTQSYIDKDFKKVVAFLKNKPEKTPEESYFLGASFINLGEYESAIAQFNQKTIFESAFAEKAEWAMALIYLKQKNKKQALPLLEKIAKSQSEFAFEAQKILED